MKKKIMRIAELGNIFPGFSPKPMERKKKGKYLLIGGRNIKDGRLIKTDKDSFIGELERPSFQRAIARRGDIIVSTLFDRRKLYIYKDHDPVAVVNNSCAIIRTENNNDYIVSYLRTLKGQEEFLNQAKNKTCGTFIPRLSIKDLGNIEIPILPIQELQKFGDLHIKVSSTDELLLLKKELESKDQEIEKLKSGFQKMKSYYENRVGMIESQIITNDLDAQIQHGETAKLEFNGRSP